MEQAKRHHAPEDSLSIPKEQNNIQTNLDCLDIAAYADDQRAHGLEQAHFLASAAEEHSASSHASASEGLHHSSLGTDIQQPEIQPCSSKALHAGPPPPSAACTRWIEAAKQGDTRELHKLLQHYPTLLNHQAGGLRCTALHWTAARGHADAMQQLLLWGADPGVLTCTGCTPLFSAAGANQCECVDLLVMLPAVQQQLDWVNEDGLTAAAYALKHGHQVVYGRLMQAAAGGPATSSVTIRPVGLEVSAHTALQAVPPQQQHPALSGLRSGFLGSKPNTSQLRRSEDTTVNSRASGGGDTPQENSALCADVLADVCLHSMKHIDVGSNTPDDNGQGSTAPGGEQRNQEDATTIGGNTFESLGISDGSLTADKAATPAAVIEATESTAAAATAAVTKQQGRAWLDAARAGDLQQLQSMLRAHPHLLMYNGAGTSYAFSSNSAAHWAAAKGHTAVLQWLLQQGKVQGGNMCALMNQAGATPLHTAAEHGQAGCAKLLILHGGADVQQQDDLGQSVVHAAAANTCRGGQQLVHQLLLWSLIQQLSRTDRSAWAVTSMQQLLKLAGKASEAATCVERHELQALAQKVIETEATCSVS